MKNDIRKRRNELRIKGVNLSKLAFDVHKDKAISIRKEQNETYKRWQFYDKLIKTVEKV